MTRQLDKMIEKVHQDDKLIVIPAQTDLRKRVVSTGSGNSAFRKAIKAAEEAIEELSVEFDDWIQGDVEEIIKTCNLIKQDGWTENNKDRLFTLTHDLKGQATTLGYPVITDICNTLCHLLEKIPDTSNISPRVVETFAESINTILNQCDKNEDNEKAFAISSGLRQMAMKILKHELDKKARQTARETENTNTEHKKTSAQEADGGSPMIPNEDVFKTPPVNESLEAKQAEPVPASVEE